VATSHSTPYAAARLAYAALLAALACASLALSCSKPTDPDTTLSGIGLSTTSVIGGTNVTGSITMTLPAPSGGANVSLSSSNGGAATVPASVVVPANVAGAEFVITTAPVAADTIVTITGTHSGVNRTAVLTVRPVPAVRADFTFTPIDPTTPPAGQCTATRATPSGGGNLLRCRFDGNASTPNPGITSYIWQFPGAVAPLTGVVVSDPLVPCGTFASVVARDVTLTVVAPNGTNATTKTITFQKVNEC
jgi:hypothetical protein